MADIVGWPCGITEYQAILATEAIVRACKDAPSGVETSYREISGNGFAPSISAIKAVLYDLRNKGLAFTFARQKSVNAWDKDAVRHVWLPHASNGAEWFIGMVNRHYQVAMFYKTGVVDWEASLDDIDDAYEKHVRGTRAPIVSIHEREPDETEDDRLTEIIMRIARMEACIRELTTTVHRLASLRVEKPPERKWYETDKWNQIKKEFGLEEEPFKEGEPF
jgi:hypothetical protein